MTNKIEKLLQKSLTNCGAIIGKNAEFSFFYVGKSSDVTPFFILTADRKPGYVFGRGYIGVSIANSDGFLNKNSLSANIPIIFMHSANFIGTAINKPIPIDNNTEILEYLAHEVIKILSSMPKSADDLRVAINEGSILNTPISKFIDPHSQNASIRYENFLNWCNFNEVSIVNMPKSVDGFDR